MSNRINCLVSKQKGGVLTSIRRVTNCGILSFFIFLVDLFFSYFPLIYIMSQISRMSNFPSPIIFYKSSFLFFLYDLVFPLYNWVSKNIYLFYLSVGKSMYTKFFTKIKKKNWLALSQRKSAYTWNSLVK